MAQRTGTIASQIEAARNADKLHPWPEQVRLGPDFIAALDVYRLAQEQRAHEDWTKLDLVELARVSKMILIADQEFERYTQEGCIVMGGRRMDRPVENPRGRAVATMNSTISASLRRLGLTGSGLGDKRAMASRAGQEREMRSAATPPSQLDETRMSDDEFLN